MHQPAKRMRDNAMRHARNIGNKARANAMKRKEEYLGARVPKELRDKVIAQADRLEIPVSILSGRRNPQPPAISSRKRSRPLTRMAQLHQDHEKKIEQTIPIIREMIGIPR